MRKKLIAGVLLFSMIGSLPVYANTMDALEHQIKENKDRIEEKEALMGDLRIQQTELSREMENIAVDILNLSHEADTLYRSISEKDTEIKEKEEEIKNKEEVIEKLRKDIRIKKKEITDTEEKIALQEELLGLRVRAAYKSSQSTSILLMLLESEGILDFIDRIVLIRKVTDSDKALIEEHNLLKEELSLKKKSFEKMEKEEEEAKELLIEERIMLQEAKKALESERYALLLNQEKMEELEREKKTLYNTLSSQEQHLSQEIGDMMEENEALEAKIQEMIREAQRKAEEERKRREEEARKNNETIPETSPSTQGYLRPVPGRITSPYGYRIHPIWGYRKMHYGIDYAGGTGSTIKATRSGTVITAQYLPSYGNTVIVNHGNGVSSLYAHMNSIEVSVGQSVSQGQRLGGVGSTGDSTGPHLHFEIRINGVRQNPANYVN